jgi:hypothetical protein
VKSSCWENRSDGAACATAAALAIANAAVSIIASLFGRTATLETPLPHMQAMLRPLCYSFD